MFFRNWAVSLHRIFQGMFLSRFLLLLRWESVTQNRDGDILSTSLLTEDFRVRAEILHLGTTGSWTTAAMLVEAAQLAVFLHANYCGVFPLYTFGCSDPSDLKQSACNSWQITTFQTLLNGTFTLTLYLKTFAVGVLKFYQVHNKYMWVNISSRYVANIPHVNKLS